MATDKAHLNVRVDTSTKTKLMILHEIFCRRNNVKISLAVFVEHLLVEELDKNKDDINAVLFQMQQSA